MDDQRSDYAGQNPETARFSVALTYLAKLSGVSLDNQATTRTSHGMILDAKSQFYANGQHVYMPYLGKAS